MKLTSILAASAIALMAASVITAPASAKEVNKANNGEFAVGQVSAPVVNTTPTENAYACFASNFLSLTADRPNFSVGKLTDQTGKFSNEAAAGGFAVTQGLTNMVYTAFGKLSPSLYGNFTYTDSAGAAHPSPDFNIVERTDTGITDGELVLADKQFLSDLSESNGLRHMKYGRIIGSDYYVTGAITELNYNIDSGGAEAYVSQIGAGKRVYTMNIAIDLRVVDSKTLRVVRTVSERKTIRGYEVKGSVFNFLGVYLIDLNTGRKAEEPIELGVRSTMESALLRLVGSVYHTSYGDQCAEWGNSNYGRVTTATLASALKAPVLAK